MFSPTSARRLFMRGIAFMLAFLLAASDGCVLSWAQQPGSLRIIILEGERAKNDVAQRSLETLTIQVQDTSAGPLQGVQVTFTVPPNGPAGAFSNGARQITITTNSDGIAAAEGFRPNDLPGDFQITVAAVYRGQRVIATINQSNLGTAQKGRSSKWIVILALGAGAAIVGGLAAKKGGSTTTTNPPPTPTSSTIRLGAGTPSAGPPG
jgi:hypothetical protein